jgi:polyhydroxyalkanoate synthesis repressor PhaR
MPTIRKYENRRLYDTEASRYVNLDDIATMVRNGAPVTVEDGPTGRDLTRETLLQVLLASEGGPELLPVGMLRRVIRATGSDPLQRLLRPHIASALELMHTQLDDLEARFSSTGPGTMGGWGMPNFVAEPAPTYDARPRPASAEPPPRQRKSESRPATPPDDDSLEALRRRLDDLEQRLKRR